MGVVSKARTNQRSKSNEKPKRRTPRACDRCRLKKAKCDGTTPCKTCRASDCACLYTAKRGREARSYYFQLREVTDEALQRLYWACRTNSGFPGEIPDESQGSPSTMMILNALGLRTPLLEDTGPSKSLQRPEQMTSSSYSDDPERVQRQHPIVTSPTTESPARNEYLPSPATSAFSMSSSAASPNTRPSLTTIVPPRPTTPTEMDTSEQFLYAASESSTSSRSSSINKREFSYINRSSSQAFDVDAYLDTSSCAIISSNQPTHDIYTSMQFDVPRIPGNASHQPHHASMASSQPATTCDGFLSPWPGSLAAIYTAAQ